MDSVIVRSATETARRQRAEDAHSALIPPSTCSTRYRGCPPRQASRVWTTPPQTSRYFTLKLNRENVSTCRFKAQELEGIKAMVQEHAEGGIRDEGLTEASFLYLHTIFIQRGRLETTWTVLRKFGYAEDLKRLTESFLVPKFEVPPDCSVELSPLGYQFFTEIFEIFDKDQDGALNANELSESFSTSPGNPWAAQKFLDTTLSDDSGLVTLQGWLAQWRTTLAFLAYLGYPEEPRTAALQVTRPRKVDRRKGKVSRNVFLCYVCGAAGSGKRSLLRAFANKSFQPAYEPTSKMITVVNAVDIDGSEKYLVLQEFGSRNEAETLRNPKKTDIADVIVYVSDSSDTNSFSYISNLRVGDLQGCMVTRLTEAFRIQRHEVQPDVYCRRLRLQVPVAVSVKTGQTAVDLWSAIPGGADRAMTAAAKLRMYVTVTAVLGGCTAGLIVLVRALLRPGSSGLGAWTTLWATWLVGHRR
ncbi:EF hand associated-domain-containing protein [Ephemerocybe angulata]|uniref:EF hand associated-domain-containing protein n=1 Tax=Ephemerocybe angulata TaxID=980116 RepID=A0A8H6HHY5_9AGAR|nr:EF hand associated-domain-containing protein [Tulosesus angulatus]